jgi:hypothetical protein
VALITIRLHIVLYKLAFVKIIVTIDALAVRQWFRHFCFMALPAIDCCVLSFQHVTGKRVIKFFRIQEPLK